MVPLLVLGKHHQVIVSTVGLLTLLLMKAARSHIHLTSDDGLEALRFQLLHLGLALGHGSCGVFALLLAALDGFDALLQVLDLAIDSTVLLVYIVRELLDGHHVPMVSHGNTTHAVGHSLVYQLGHTCLPVKYRILCMYV